jgi:hypothetical protein
MTHQAAAAAPGGEQRHDRAIEKPVEVRDAPGVPAQQAMLAEQPQVAALGRRLVGWGRDVVGVRLAGLRHRGSQLGEHRGQRLGVDRHIRQQRPQLLVVGTGHRRQRVERGEHERFLVRLEVDVQDGDRGR